MEQSEQAGVPSTGVIGLGDIGRGLADNLLGAGVALSVYDVRPEATDPFRPEAHVAESPGDLARHSDVVMVAVVNDAQVRSVLQGADGVFAQAAPGTSVVIVSTIATSTVTQLHAEGSAHGVTIVDCGVSGGPAAAASGELVCMVGGTAEDVERVRPVLDAHDCGQVTPVHGPYGHLRAFHRQCAPPHELSLGRTAPEPAGSGGPGAGGAVPVTRPPTSSQPMRTSAWRR